MTHGAFPFGWGTTSHVHEKCSEEREFCIFHVNDSYMKVLVTDGAGYIGSVVVQELLRAGNCVTVYDNLSHGKRSAVPDGAEVIVGDVGDRESLSGALRHCAPEAVMHFAALIEAAESMSVPERYFRNNTASTLTLLQTMLEHGTKQIVFSSTAALYGNPERTPIEEDAPARPASPYGASKLAVDTALAEHARMHKIGAVSLRYFNVAGAAAGPGGRRITGRGAELSTG